jgi:hypothetical protein
MDEKPSKKSPKGYGKHSMRYWVVVYLIAAVVIYGVVYLVFIHKGSGSGY